MTFEVSQQKTLKSTLKWVGGKRRIAAEITKFFPKTYGRYFEPFVGGGSVFLAAEPRAAVLSDVNRGLINYYSQLRDYPEALMEAATDLENAFNRLASQDSKKQHFYEQRLAFNGSDRAGVQAAAVFLYLNKTAFNGLYRENTRGEFNVPFNNKETLALFDLENLQENSKRLKGVELANVSFEQAVTTAEAGDLVYFDPPYIPISSTAAFTAYSKSPFGPSAQTNLRDTARQLISRGVAVVLSNSHCAEVSDLYTGFDLHEVQINRLVAASGAARSRLSEFVIVGNPQ
jgi:DNA adenine methylase